MKKLISLCLALALVMSLSTTAFAADETDVGVGDYSTAVTGSTVNGTTGNGTVFMVDISWTGMNFTYHGAKEPTWDAENHTYTDRVAAWWEGQGTISIVNDSNTRIYAAPSYTASTGFEDADMVFSTDELHVASAEYGSQQSGTITVTPSGSLPNDTQNKTIGTITVTIAESTGYVSLQECETLCSDAVYDLITDIRASELYNTNSELQNKVAALDTDSDSLLADVLAILDYSDDYRDNDDAGDIHYRYMDVRERYYALQTYYNTLQEA